MTEYLCFNVMIDLNEKIWRFFIDGLDLCKKILKRDNELHFIIYEKDINKMKEVEIDVYIYDRLQTLINNYLLDKYKIKLEEDKINKITKTFMDIYYPNFLKELYK